MKTIKAFFLVLFCVLNLYGRAQTTWTDQVYNPDVPNIEHNPLKGWMPGYQPVNSSFPYSVDHFYISLKSVYTNWGQFDWTAFDNELNRITSGGRQAVPRFWINYPTRPNGLPDFLLPLVPLYSDGSPYWNDEDLMLAMEEFIAFFGARYDGDPRIVFIEAGLYGKWGEWHCYPENDRQMTQANKDRLLIAYKNAFNTTHIGLRQSNHASTAHKMSFGYYDDSFAQATLCTGGWCFWNGNIVPDGITNVYQFHPIGGELRPEIQDDIFDAWPNASTSPEGMTMEDLETCITTTHLSFMKAYYLYKYIPTSTEWTNALRAHKMMGYQFYVRSVKITSDASNPVKVELNLQNRGVAPIYYNWQVEFSAINSANQWLGVIGTANWNTNAIMPNATDYYKAFTGNLPAGDTYKILMRFKNPLDAYTSNAKVLRFANAKQDADQNGWLTLGTVAVSNTINAFTQIEAESYSSMFGVQSETCSEGGQNIGYIENGDYIVFNNVNFGTGAASFEARVASSTNGGSIEVRLGSPTGTLVGTCAVTNTGGWQTWTTKTCAISGASGMQNLYLKFTGGTGYLFNFNWFKFTAAPTTYTLTTDATNGTVTRDPSGSSYSAGTVVTLTATPNSGYTFTGWSGDLSGSTNPTTITMNSNKSVTANFSASNINAFSQIEAENYSSQSGVQTQTCSEGGLNISHIENGDYIVFNNVDFGTGAVSFDARVASGTAGGSIEVRLGSPTGTLVGTCAVTNTGGWQTWTTKTCAISGASGMQNLYLKFTGGTGYLFNLNWITFIAGSLPDVTALTGWVSGTTNNKVSGSERLMTVMVMGEHGSSDISATGVTYGGQAMTKRTERVIGTGFRTYASIFTLNESGVNAASSGTINVTWNTAPSGFNVYSVLLANVDQTTPVSATANNALTGTTVTTSSLAAASGDMIVMCGATADNTTITFNNGFTKQFESNAGWGDGVGGNKMGTDTNQTPSFTQSASGRMVICAIVAKKSPVLKSATIEITAGVLDKNADNSIFVYPNPVSRELNIDFVDNKSRNITIYNLYGQVLYNEKTNSSKVQIDVASIKAKGMIIIQVASGKDMSIHKVLVK